MTRNPDRPLVPWRGMYVGRRLGASLRRAGGRVWLGTHRRWR